MSGASQLNCRCLGIMKAWTSTKVTMSAAIVRSMIARQQSLAPGRIHQSLRSCIRSRLGLPAPLCPATGIRVDADEGGGLCPGGSGTPLCTLCVTLVTDSAVR